MSTDKVKELEERLASMQKELEELKKEEKKVKGGIYEKYKDRLNKAEKEVRDIIAEMVNEGADIVSVAITAGKHYHKRINQAGLAITSIENIPEDGISAALDVFTNPRRIALLKSLMMCGKSANALSKETGLIGGQLYHHLSSLENAGLIGKHNHANGYVEYYTNDIAYFLLNGISAVVGAMDIARNNTRPENCDCGCGDPK